MKLSDYVAARLADWGARHVFLVTGGAAMHLNDSFGNEPRLRCVCTHHEQAAAMAAEGYARIAEVPAIVNVTAGPGGLNALNGVFGAWTDSIPMLVVSGQVKRETCMAIRGSGGLRQLGDQEVDIVAIAKGITKYAVLVDDPASIRYHLERAWHLARSGRPGPCWLDIPIDVQAAAVEHDAMRGYDPAQDELPSDTANLPAVCAEIVRRIAAAERPVILAGTGVRLANAVEEFAAVVRRLGVPVATAWTHDLIASDDPHFCGRAGTIGGRAGNFTVQNSDLVLVLGSRLNIRQVSYNWESFASGAFKIQVDIDAAELRKPLVRPDLAVTADLKLFLPELLRQLDGVQYRHGRHAGWLAWCRERLAKYPSVREAQRQPGPPLNPYYFIERLGAMLCEDDVVVCGNATACITAFQALPLRRGQRLFSNSGSASMGYDLPAAIGAATARAGKRVVCLAGDGSLQMNMQELQTLVHYRLPVKLFVLNNGGYLSIRSTQANFFGRTVGEGPATGVSLPDMGKVAAAYGIATVPLDRESAFAEVEPALAADGPALINVALDTTQEFEPRMRSRQLPDGRIVSPALDDMYPFLERDELAANRFAKAAAGGGKT